MPFRIPELTTGVIGASTLNLYSNALNHLLGESHATYALAQIDNSHSTTATIPHTEETRYLYHVTPTLFYDLALKTEDDGRGSTTTCTLYDVTTSATLATITSTSVTWERKTGTIDISAQGHVEGDIITIAVRLHTSNADSDAELYVFALGERGAISGWQTLPTFAAGPSAVAHVNVIRTNLNILLDNMVSPVNPLLANRGRIKVASSDVYTNIFRAGYRYRGDNLHVIIEAKGGGNNGWLWRLLASPASNPESDTLIYEAPAWVAPTEGYTIDSAIVDMSGLGWTVGDEWMLRLQVKRDAYPAVWVRRAWLMRTSDGAPGGSWAVPNQWAHGDTTMNAATLGKWTADLTELYTGGHEALWGETHAALPTPGEDEDESEDRTLTGIHRKRWLVVKLHSDETPVLHYGTEFESVHDLGGADIAWVNYDLDATELPIGGYYAVEQCDCAFEADEPCNE